MNIKKRILFLGILCTIVYCTPEKDFEIPEVTIEEPNIEGNIVTVDAIVGMLGQAIEKEGENAKVVFEDTNMVLYGYVISSDKASNFFKELILQDRESNPKAGVRILVNTNPLFTTYEFGRKIYTKLDGLSLGIQNGVATLGIAEGNDIGAIPSFSVDEVIVRSSDKATIIPLPLTIEDFTDNILQTYIKIDGVQFHKNIVQEGNVFTFAAEAHDEFDGERILESCATGRNTLLSTSTFSDFKGLKLPITQGSFEGILTKNFEGDRYNLVLNDPNGLTFTNETRCDPVVLECSISNTGSKIVFEEDFTGLKKGDLEDKGWINSNTLDGDLTYKIGDFAENQYAQITGFRSKESMYEVWLITPEISIEDTIEEVLLFDLQAGFDNGNLLDVFVTESFTGDIQETDWMKLNAAIPRAPLNSFGNFTSSGSIGLSCLNGNIRIGFRYVGGDPKSTTRYHIDNIKVVGE